MLAAGCGMLGEHQPMFGTSFRMFPERSVVFVAGPGKSRNLERKPCKSSGLRPDAAALPPIGCVVRASTT